MSEKARPAWVQTTIITVASMLLAFVVAAVIMVVSDAEVAAKWAYFFSRPGDALGASWDKIATTFYAMWYGSMGNWVNITNTTAEATPLIAAGLLYFAVVVVLTRVMAVVERRLTLYRQPARPQQG